MKVTHVNQEGDVGKRVPLGYVILASIKPLVREWCQTSLWVSFLTALGDHTTGIICGVLGQAIGWSYGWWSWLLLHLLILWPLCGRALRGLENLTHEASHGNFAHNAEERNDRAGDWLCARWVFLSVDAFERAHRSHHDEFGTNHDPDKRRLAQRGGQHISRESLWQLILSLLRLLLRYVVAYWAQFNESPSRLAVSVALHFGLVTCGVLLFGPLFPLWWSVYFLIPFLVYLPVIRFLAESEEHHYEEASTVFAATYSNTGRLQRWLLHPHGDAYHLLHHLIQAIPHWKVRTAHNILWVVDPSYREGKIRTSILSPL